MRKVPYNFETGPNSDYKISETVLATQKDVNLHNILTCNHQMPMTSKKLASCNMKRTVSLRDYESED